MSNEGFKAIIVGGSVSGLSFAKMLEGAGIDYVVLEAYPEIAPQLGAGIGLLGNGLRILDQLGCYDDLCETEPAAVQSATLRSSSGILTCTDGLDEIFRKRLGYPFIFLDRKTLLQTLYHNIRSKPKVYTSKRVVGVELIGEKVRVATDDGSTFMGDILVGADGIRSKVREEMWRIAGKCQPGYFPSSEVNRMRCDYACIFGISNPIGTLRRGKAISIFREQHSFFVVGGPGDQIYWFLFVGLGRTMYGQDIPRFTKDDEERVAKEHWDAVIDDDVTLGDLYTSRRTTVMTPLQECVFMKWHFRRIITIGDAAHKFHPIDAQGGNSALETAAALSNALVQALEKSNHPSSEEIQAAFAQVQTLRRSRAEMFVRAGHTRQRIEAMENVFFKFIALHIVPLAGRETIFQRFYDRISPAIKLDNMVVPSQSRQAPFQDELPPAPPPALSRTCIMAGFLCLASMAWKLRQVLSLENTAPLSAANNVTVRHDGVLLDSKASLFEQSFAQQMHLYYYLTILISYIALWTVEGSRKKLLWSIVYSPLIWGFGCYKYGFGIVAPIYYLVSLYHCPDPRDFLPFRRSLSVSTSKAIIIALVSGTLLPTILVLLLHHNSELQLRVIKFWQLWPVFVTFLMFSARKFLKHAGPSGSLDQESKIPELPYIKGLYVGAFLVAAIGHLSIIYICLTSSIISLPSVFVASSLLATVQSTPEQTFNSQKYEMYIFVLGSLLWLFVSIWDLNRLGLSTVGQAQAAMLIVIGSILVGPGAVAAAVWYWRELIISNIIKLV